MTLKRILRFVFSHSRVFRLAFLTVCDLGIVFGSVVAALFLYTRLVHLDIAWSTIVRIALVLFAVRYLAFHLLRIYRVSFQYANLLFAVRIAVVLVGTSALSYVGLRYLYPGLWPLPVAVMEMTFCILGSIAFRLSSLLYWELSNMKVRSGRTALIYGAGQSGRSIARLLGQSEPTTRILGFLDDNPNLKGRVIYGHRVLGRADQLRAILARLEVDQIIVGIPSLSGDRLRKLRRECVKLNIAVRVLPSVYELYKRPAEEVVATIRDIDLQDLLRRPVREIPFSRFETFFRGRTLMVTGGGGAIGSELVSQLVRLGPKTVVVPDMSELALFELEAKVGDHGPLVAAHLADLKDEDQLRSLFQTYRPEIVFHAAAYKHVPFVERDPGPGIVNNLVSLRNTARLAAEHDVERFLFVSSDKAVCPTNLMGATKRVGELYIQAMNGSSGTTYCCVRFGNVIGSSGSLVPKVVRCIKENRPIELTHPDMTRYLMSIPEAVSLILQACMLSRGGEMFILDMGEPIRILDLIHEVCLLHGKQPGKDQEIRVVGIRPGEKLHEELVYAHEEASPVAPGISSCLARAPGLEGMNRAIDATIACARHGDADGARGHIASVIRLGQDVATCARTEEEAPSASAQVPER